MPRQTREPEAQNNQQKKSNGKTTLKQIAALVCVVLLVGMYIGAFIVACLDPGDSGRLFAGCLVATIGIPILLWLLIWSFELMKKRQADNRPPQETEDTTHRSSL